MRAEGNLKYSGPIESIKTIFGAIVTAGAVVVLSAARRLVGVAMSDFAAAEEGTFYIDGVFEFPIAAGVTINLYQRVYWDPIQLCVTAVPAAPGDPLLGMAVEAGTAVGGRVKVRINHPPAQPILETILADTVTTVGGGAAEVVAVPGVVATDTVTATVVTPGAVARTLNAVTPGADTITLTFSGDPDDDHVVRYKVERAV